MRQFQNLPVIIQAEVWQLRERWNLVELHERSPCENKYGQPHAEYQKHQAKNANRPTPAAKLHAPRTKRFSGDRDVAFRHPGGTMIEIEQKKADDQVADAKGGGYVVVLRHIPYREKNLSGEHRNSCRHTKHRGNIEALDGADEDEQENRQHRRQQERQCDFAHGGAEAGA